MFLGRSPGTSSWSSLPQSSHNVLGSLQDRHEALEREDPEASTPPLQPRVPPQMPGQRYHARELRRTSA